MPTHVLSDQGAAQLVAAVWQLQCGQRLLLDAVAVHISLLKDGAPSVICPAVLCRGHVRIFRHCPVHTVSTRPDAVACCGEQQLPSCKNDLLHQSGGLVRFAVCSCSSVAALTSWLSPQCCPVPAAECPAHLAPTTRRATVAAAPATNLPLSLGSSTSTLARR